MRCGFLSILFPRFSPTDRVAFEGGYDCIATGHNLDDEVAALFGNVLSWDMNFLSRQNPVSPQRGDRLMRKIKPFCYFSERETAMFTILAGICLTSRAWSLMKSAGRRPGAAWYNVWMRG